MTAAEKAAIRLATARVNSVKSELIDIYDQLAAAGCNREAETLRNVCRNLEDRQTCWLRRIARS